MNQFIDLELTVSDGDVPRCRDIDLGAFLEYSRPRDVRKLIKQELKSGNLNDYDARAVLARTTVSQPTSGSDGLPSVQREVVEYRLTREAALFVASKSDTKRGTLILNELIRVFSEYTAINADKVFSSQYLEQRLLEVDNRRAWEVTWDESVLRPICRLYGWPVYSKGRMFAPLSSVINRVYRYILGDAVVNELKRRIPKPQRGKNWHQLLQDKVREMLGGDLSDVRLIAQQSLSVDEFWMRMSHHFRGTGIQKEWW